MIFEDISFNAKKGEFVTLLGPSGCGKSTLLRCITGLSQINGGKILINDKDITKLSPQKRNMGMVFQNYALFPNLNVFENIAFGLKIKKMDKKDIEKRVKKMLKLVELEEYAKIYPHKLSGGQMQRVALARSLVTKPDLLLLDEPLSALDAKIRKHLRIQIKEIQKELNLTTIFVTHDQEEALEMSDRIILMNEGKIMQNSNASNLYLLPECHFVASFIGNYNILSPKELDNLGLEHDFKKDIALRPETIEISNEGLEAKIKEKSLLGNIIRYKVKLQEIELKVDTLNFSTYSAFEVGDKIALKFNLSLAKELR
ncbi:ABC transporter ATP-binding protein [Campylobacter coli]|nr:ABC transporter ATP-binding protein [Campylobacter coli]EDH7278532.1 ABC transporter ATP-binding protein [Campylobacter coli]